MFTDEAIAATLDAPDGWIVLESYNDWLVERREARCRAGLWSTVPTPARGHGSLIVALEFHTAT